MFCVNEHINMTVNFIIKDYWKMIFIPFLVIFIFWMKRSKYKKLLTVVKYKKQNILDSKSLYR